MELRPQNPSFSVTDQMYLVRKYADLSLHRQMTSHFYVSQPFGSRAPSYTFYRAVNAPPLETLHSELPVNRLVQGARDTFPWQREKLARLKRRAKIAARITYILWTIGNLIATVFLFWIVAGEQSTGLRMVFYGQALVICFFATLLGGVLHQEVHDTMTWRLEDKL